MARNARSAALLRQIAETVGVDVGAFRAISSADALARLGGDAAPQHPASIQLLRLVRTFRSLPSDECRGQALQLLEAFAARMCDRPTDLNDYASPEDAA